MRAPSRRDLTGRCATAAREVPRTRRSMRAQEIAPPVPRSRRRRRSGRQDEPVEAGDGARVRGILHPRGGRDVGSPVREARGRRERTGERQRDGRTRHDDRVRRRRPRRVRRDVERRRAAPCRVEADVGERIVERRGSSEDLDRAIRRPRLERRLRGGERLPRLAIERVPSPRRDLRGRSLDVPRRVRPADHQPQQQLPG